MNMNKWEIGALVAILLAIVFVLFSCGGDSEKQKKQAAAQKAFYEMCTKNPEKHECKKDLKTPAYQPVAQQGNSGNSFLENMLMMNMFSNMFSSGGGSAGAVHHYHPAPSSSVGSTAGLVSGASKTSGVTAKPKTSTYKPRSSFTQAKSYKPKSTTSSYKPKSSFKASSSYKPSRSYSSSSSYRPRSSFSRSRSYSRSYSRRR